MSRFLHFSSRAISFFHRRALRSSALELRWIKGLITVGIIYMSIYMSIYIYIYLDKYNYIHSITFFHSCTVDLHMEWWQPTWFHQGQRDGVWRSTDGKDSRTADDMSVFFVLCFKITGELVDCERLQFPCFKRIWASFWHVLILESDKAEQIFNYKLMLLSQGEA